MDKTIKKNDTLEGLKWIQKCDVINILAEMIRVNDDLQEECDDIGDADYYWGASEALKGAIETVENLDTKTPDDILILYNKGGICKNAGICTFYTKSKTLAEINKKESE